MVFRVEFDLGEAADVSGGDDFGSGGGEVLHFALSERFGRIRMFNIVAASGSAADFPFSGFQEGESGYGLKKLPRRRANFLSVGQVAGVVVGDGLRGGVLVLGRREADLIEILADVDDSAGEVSGLLEDFRILPGEEGAVFFHSGTAAGRGGDDGVDIVREGVKIAGGGSSGFLGLADVHGE